MTHHTAVSQMERRRHERHTVNQAGYLRPLGQNQNHDIIILDMSECGFGIELDIKLTIGSEWEIVADKETDEFCPTPVVRIVWCRPADSERFLAGCVVI